MSAPIIVTPKQQMFHDSVARHQETGFGGARGPGKSFALGHEALRQSIYYPGNLGAIVRKDLVDLKDTTMETLRRYVLPPYQAQGLKARFTGGNRPDLEIDTGRGISTILWRDAKDEASLMSANLGWVAFDEAVEVSEDFYLMISAAIGRCRLPDGTLAPKRLFWASNPGPGWPKRYFPVGNKPCKRPVVKIGDDGLEYTTHAAFIPALPRDNPNLPPNYEADLRAKYPDVWVRRFLDGDWSAFEGQVFPEFDHSIHVLERDPEIGEGHYLHILTADWGYRSPFAALLVSIDAQGNFLVSREYRATERTPDMHLPYLRKLCEGVKIHVHLMDPAAVDQSDGVTLRDQFTDLGMPFIGYAKQKTGPEGSITFLKTLLRDHRIKIAPKCAGLITELSEAMWERQTPAMADKRNPVERMQDKDDHSIDALFGALQWYRSRPAAPLTEQQQARVEAQERFHMERSEAHNNVLRRRDEWGKPVGQRHRGLRI
jgi:hypothetical protein